MPLVLPFVLLSAATQPPPDRCESPSENDTRPYTLCLAETWFDKAELELNTQLRITLAHMRAQGGAAAERRLRKEQQRWLRARHRECAAFARSSPVTQTSRNELTCFAQLDERRTAYLKRLVGRPLSTQSRP